MAAERPAAIHRSLTQEEEEGGGGGGGFDLDWLPSTHTNNKRAIFRLGEGEEEEEEEKEQRRHLGK